MRVSVVIPAYNGRGYLEKNLPEVLKLQADEVIVVDDASTDGTYSFLQKKFPQVTLIKHEKNLRFPRSVNDGFKKASGEIVILLNQDVKPEVDLVKKIVSHFDDPKILAVTFAEKNRSWAKGEIVNGFLQFENGPRDDQIHESLWASGGSAAFRKSTWDLLGGFDPVFSPGYYEDLDLSWRARNSGYKIIWDPNCRVDHVTESVFPTTFGRSLDRIKERNYLIAHWKNLSGVPFLQHLLFLVIRIIKTPGFIVPTIMAIWRKLVS